MVLIDKEILSVLLKLSKREQSNRIFPEIFSLQKWSCLQYLYEILVYHFVNVRNVLTKGDCHTAKPDNFVYHMFLRLWSEISLFMT